MDIQNNGFDQKYNELTLAYNDLLAKNKILSEQVETLINQNKNFEEQLNELTAKQEKLKGIRYKMVTVLYAEIKGFNKLSKQINADELVDEIDELYHHFDTIVKKFNIVKANSIGDTYICVGGLPKKNHTNPIEVVLAAIEILEYMDEIQSKSNKKNIWKISIGIHTGPVVATSSGKKNFIYDIKGDTANIASRIVSSMSGGKINISANTHEFVKDYFRCGYNGKLPVKFTGDISIFNIKGLRPEYSENGEGVIPNKDFNIKFALIKFDDLEECVLDKLEAELPKNLYYHNLKHTIDVLIQVEIIGRGENINDEELLILKTAALLHDSGQITGSLNHELHGTKIAEEVLPKFGYSPAQISEINSIILATKLPPDPKTKLQKIICDADLDYLGRSDFIPVSNTLFKELNQQGIVNNINDWNKMQLKFISGHQYFTETALKLREINKHKQIERLQQLIV
jgi:adenylate cyclase